MSKRSIIRQGDVILIPITEVPSNTTPVARRGGRLILAEGEVTGHAHAITDKSCELVTTEGAAELYLLVHGSEPVALLHEDHATVTIPAGTYERRILREYSPEATRPVQD